MQIEGLIDKLGLLKAKLFDIDDSRSLLGGLGSRHQAGGGLSSPDAAVAPDDSHLSQEFSQSSSQMQKAPCLEGGKPSQTGMSAAAKHRTGLSRGFQFPLLPPRPVASPLPLCRYAPAPSPQPLAPSPARPLHLAPLMPLDLVS